MRADVWEQVGRNLNAQHPECKQWSEEVVMRAIDRIEGLAKQRSLEARLIPHTWSPERVNNAEERLFQAFPKGDFEGAEALPQTEYGLEITPALLPEKKTHSVASSVIQEPKSRPKIKLPTKKEDQQ